MNVDGSCTASCNDYHNTQNYRCNADTLCAQEMFRSDKQKCKGRLRDCQPLEGDISVCPAVSNKQSNHDTEKDLTKYVFAITQSDKT